MRGRERLARSAGLAVRALLVALLGLVLGGLESGLAVILTYYGVLFLLRPAVPRPARPRAVPARPVPGWWSRRCCPTCSARTCPRAARESPTFDQLADPGQLLSELLVTGYYPVLPWLAYLLVGMGLGRLDLTQRRVQAPSPRSAPRSPLLATVAVASPHPARRGAHGPRLGPSDAWSAGHRPGPDRLRHVRHHAHRRRLAVAAGRRPALGDALRPRPDDRERAAS